MFQYANRRMGGVARWWRRRRLAHTAMPAEISDLTALGALVPADDPPALFTAAEDAEVAEGHSSQRTIEAAYNGRLSKRLGQLAGHAPDLERRKVHQLRLADDARGVGQRLRRAELAHRGMRDHGRHLPRPARFLLVLVLAAVDVIAYRAAVEVAFDTSDEWPAIIDSYLLALLSLGMVMAAMFAAEQLKALHTARDRRIVEPDLAEDDQRHARRVWLQAGLPALMCAAGLLIAGSALRVNALVVPPRWFWIAVPVFSASAAIGAFFVEYKWASKALDERDDLERRSRRAGGRLRRADRQLAKSEGEFRRREAEIGQLWSIYEPSWRVQMEMAAARIAAARSEHPELFHPLGRSVVESVHERIARGTTRRDPRPGLAQLELTVEHVLERARVTHMMRAQGRAELDELAPPAMSSPPPSTTASTLAVPATIGDPSTASGNGHDRPADVDRKVSPA